MKTNWPEKMWVNSPVRLLIQRGKQAFFRTCRTCDRAAPAWRSGAAAELQYR